MAFAQSMVETGSFGNPDTIDLNNFAGIGHCDHCASGMGFDTAQLGVRGQMQLLKSYAETDPTYANPLVNSKLHGPAGCCQTWTQLTKKWASDPNYGPKILSVYEAMLEWLLDRAGDRAGPAAGAGRVRQPGVDLHDDLDVHDGAEALIAGLKPTRRSPGLPSSARPRGRRTRGMGMTEHVAGPRPIDLEPEPVALEHASRGTGVVRLAWSSTRSRRRARVRGPRGRLGRRGHGQPRRTDQLASTTAVTTTRTIRTSSWARARPGWRCCPR